MDHKSKYITIHLDNNKYPVVLYKGRIGRSQFIFSFTIFSIIGYVISQIVDNLINYFLTQTNDINIIYKTNWTKLLPLILLEFTTILIILLTTIGFILIFVSVFSKRFHDIGKNGYWGLLGLIPILNTIILIYLIFKKGTSGINKFGEPPSTFFI